MKANDLCKMSYMRKLIKVDPSKVRKMNEGIDDNSFLRLVMPRFRIWKDNDGCSCFNFKKHDKAMMFLLKKKWSLHIEYNSLKILIYMPYVA